MWLCTYTKHVFGSPDLGPQAPQCGWLSGLPHSWVMCPACCHIRDIVLPSPCLECFSSHCSSQASTHSHFLLANRAPGLGGYRRPMPVNSLQLPRLPYSSCGTVFRAGVGSGCGPGFWTRADMVWSGMEGLMGWPSLLPVTDLHRLHHNAHLLTGRRTALWVRSIRKKAAHQGCEGKL